MATHSIPDEGERPVGSFPVRFARKFRPWRYEVSHSTLKVRSVDPESVPDFIELTFYGVIGMKLKTVYSPLEVTIAEPMQGKEMLRFADVSESKAARVHCLALKAPGGDGLVACLSYSIWAHPKGFDTLSSGVSHSDSVLIVKS